MRSTLRNLVPIALIAGGCQRTAQPDPVCVPVVEVPYDGLDQDCGDGDLVDVDGDGWPGPTVDCDDNDADINPLADEVAHDAIDQDCDGADLLDGDGDGHDTPEDCNDADADIFPGAPDVPYDDIDQDCDGADRDDLDEDSWKLADDCDDHDPSVHPAADELCGNGIDDNCDDYVDEMVVGSTHATIEEALDAACAPFDTVWVLPGTYYENLVFPAIDLVLQSTDGPEVTIVDGGECVGTAIDPCRVLFVNQGNGSASVLSGFTVRGGAAETYAGGVSCDRRGGGICVAEDSAFTVEDSIVEDNYAAARGGGLAADGIGSALFVVRTTIRGNTAFGAGGGIDYKTGWGAVTNSLITENASFVGGGMHVSTSGPTEVTDNVISANVAETLGGGLYYDETFWPEDFLRNQVQGNTAGMEGGGIIVDGGAVCADVDGSNVISGNDPDDCDISPF